MGHLLGYARVSTADQHPYLQVDALIATGCYRMIKETTSGGTRTDRPPQAAPGPAAPRRHPGGLEARSLARSLRHLVDTVTELTECGIGFRSLQEAIDTTTPGGKLVFHVFDALAEFERDLSRAHQRRPGRRPSPRPPPEPAAAAAADRRY
jgi:DNA invertase Pin-like site-specific DNA recombinase